ncbi:hypothetical protein CSKR_105951 [Clonorchis sinensis]|uniref:Uncharacterized protein n=1 Tax=Clonorchis sinensis TaxID=79923 RepID=A0A3R7CGQ8_CLOSI|nr:hypothetical protein CSKR_105951 [Clonorchis sinensis]
MLRSSESYAKFLGQMSTEVLRLSIAIYIVHHVPPGMDAGEFTHQLQRHFSARERRKEQLFGMFQRYQNCRLDIEPVLNSSRENTEKQLAEREFQLQNTLKMLNFKLEFNSDYQTCDSEHSMPNLLRTFAQSVQELFANCYSRRQDLGLINVTDLLGYNSIFYDIKRFIQNWTNLAFSKDCQRCSLSVWLPLIWNSISCGLRSGAEKNVYWRSTNQILLEALGSKVATMEIQKSDQRVITFIHQVVTSLMDTAKCSLENLAETSGQNYTSRVNSAAAWLWILINFLKFYKRPTFPNGIVRLWCSRLDTLSSLLSKEDHVTEKRVPVLNAGCLFLAFTLRNRIIRLALPQ